MSLRSSKTILLPTICFIALFVESKYVENELVRFIFRSEVQFTFVIGELIDEVSDKCDKLTALSLETVRRKEKLVRRFELNILTPVIAFNWGGLVKN